MYVPRPTAKRLAAQTRERLFRGLLPTEGPAEEDDAAGRKVWKEMDSAKQRKPDRNGAGDQRSRSKQEGDLAPDPQRIILYIHRMEWPPALSGIFFFYVALHMMTPH